MSTIDIRYCIEEPVDIIKFSDAKNAAEQINNSGKHITVVGGGRYIYVNKSDVPNLIKALEKAQEIWKD